MDYKELYEFSENLGKLLEKSNYITETTVASICELEVKIDECHLNLKEFFTNLDTQELCIQNIEITVKQLDSFVCLFDIINTDSLKIAEGPQGAISAYIDKLVYIKTIQKYHFIKELKNNFFKGTFNQYKNLMALGENMLVEEFNDVFKHYSNTETQPLFIEHLTGESVSGNKLECKILFLPDETIVKLENICWWFLQQEQAYELYNDSGEHCDINQKLQYCHLRFEFIKSVMRTHSLKLHDSKVNSSVNESTPSRTNLFGLITFKDDSKEKNTTAAQCIELFNKSLDFFLKLLRHETILLQSIYRGSPETQDDLGSNLTIMVMASIESEFEEFFINANDFSKLVNNGEDVVGAFVDLVVRVQNLKKKISSLQSKDLSSASKLLQFSMRLNEMTAQVFSGYLQTVKSGYFNKNVVPSDCSVHEMCVKNLQLAKLINNHSSALLEPLKAACKKAFSENSKSTEESDPSAEYLNARNQRGRRKDTFKQDDDQDDYSTAFVAKYFSLLIESLCYFLTEEAEKFCKDSVQLILSESVSVALSYCKLGEFKENLRSLKAFLFLINNLEYMRKFIEELNLTEVMQKACPELEETIQNKLSESSQKACDVFRFLAKKWQNIEYECGYHSSLTSEAHSSIVSRIFKKPNVFNPLAQTNQKKRSDFLLMLREVLKICAKIKVQAASSNEYLKQMIREIINPVLNKLNDTDELSGILADLNICGFKEMNVINIYEKIF